MGVDTRGDLTGCFVIPLRQFCDRFQEPAAMTDRNNVDVLEVGIGKARQQVGVDEILGERLRILA
jgi:hypothetical protein